MAGVFLTFAGIKKFFLKNLTDCRLSDFVSDVVTKNLNKKVGCALIAASLLAASSVQGSNTVGVTGMKVQAPWGRVATIVCADGYGLVVIDGKGVRVGCTRYGQSWDGWESAIRVVVVEKNSNLSLETLGRQGFPGFMRYARMIDGIWVELFHGPDIKILQGEKMIVPLPLSKIERSDHSSSLPATNDD
jgi:hypothetical protein